MPGKILTTACLVAALCLGQGFTIKTVAGDGVQGFTGDNGLAVNAEIFAASGVAVDNAGNIYIPDTGNARVRKVSTTGVITTVAGNGVIGFSGDNGPAVNASLAFPRFVAIDSSGNLYISDSGNSLIRKVDLNGTITTFAGTTPGFSGDGGPASQAQLYDVYGLAFDTAGNLFLADRFNNRIRKIALDGTISTVVGSGAQGFSGEGGPALNAAMYYPATIAFDTAGNMYIDEPTNNAVRKVSTSGIITTILGGGFGVYGFSGDGGPAINGLLNDPQSAVVDQAGNIYITDEDNQRIRMVSPSGIITTIAGNGTGNFSGDGGPALKAQINLPQGMALGPDGTIYFLDYGNKRIRALVPPALTQLPAITPGGVVSASAFGEFSAVAPGSWIEIYGTNLAPVLNSWSGVNFSGAAAPTSLIGTSVTIGGVPAFVEYVDPGHVNVQVASTVATGPQPLVVKTAAGSSAAYTVTVNATEAGLLAPPSFAIGGTQYVTALFSDGSYVLPPGAISGLPARRAHAGDIITIYGVGFGAVTPAIPAGQIVQQTNALAADLQVKFGATPATLLYSGLAPGAVGLYQFNVVVPSVPASDTVPLTFTLGGAAGIQTLFIAVQ